MRGSSKTPPSFFAISTLRNEEVPLPAFPLDESPTLDDRDPASDPVPVSVSEIEIVDDSNTKRPHDTRSADPERADLRRIVSEPAVTLPPPPPSDSKADLDVMNLSGGLFPESAKLSTQTPPTRARGAWAWWGVTIASCFVVWAATRSNLRHIATRALTPEKAQATPRDEARPGGGQKRLAQDTPSTHSAPSSPVAVQSAPEVGSPKAPAASLGRSASPPSAGHAWSKPAPAASASESPQPSAPEPPVEPSPPFDKAAAIAAIESGAAAAASCKGAEDPSGSARLAVTFAPSGHVTSVLVTNPPFAATKTGSCIADALRNVSIPSFEGEPVMVFRTIEIR